MQKTMHGILIYKKIWMTLQNVIKDGITPWKSGLVIYYEGNLFFSCKKENNQLSENIFNLWM